MTSDSTPAFEIEKEALKTELLWTDPRTSPARGSGLFLAGRPIPRNKSILIRSREDAGSHHGFLGIHPDERSCAGFLCE